MRGGVLPTTPRPACLYSNETQERRERERDVIVNSRINLQPDSVTQMTEQQNGLGLVRYVPIWNTIIPIWNINVPDK